MIALTTFTRDFKRGTKIYKKYSDKELCTSMEELLPRIFYDEEGRAVPRFTLEYEKEYVILEKNSIYLVKYFKNKSVLEVVSGS